MIEWILEFSKNLTSAWGYYGIFFLSLAGSSIIPIPNELVMLFGGFLSFSGQLSIYSTIVLGSLGNFTGCVICYYIGYFGGRPFLEKYGRYFLVTPKKLNWSDSFYEKYGHGAVFITRLIPIIRAINSLPAGISRMDFKKFTLYSLAGSVVWAVGLGIGGYLLGPHWESLMAIFRKLDYVVIALIVIAIGVYIYKGLSYRERGTDGG